MDLHKKFIKGGFVLDCGKNSSTIYSASDDTCKEIKHSSILNLPFDLPKNSVVVCEAAHLQTPRTKLSRSQPFTEEQLLKLYKDFKENNITLKLFPQQSTPRACAYSNLKKSDLTDPKSIYILLKDFKAKFDTLENTKKSLKTPKIRKKSYEYQSLTNAFVNIARREDDKYQNDECSKWIRKNLKGIASRLNDDAKDLFGLTEGQQYKTTTKHGEKGEYKQNDVRIPAIYAVVITIMDDEGNIRVREETGNMPGWKYVKKYILKMTPNHFKGGVARSNLYHHLLTNYVIRKGKEKGLDFTKKIETKEGQMRMKRGSFTPEEDKFFLERRKVFSDGVRQLWQTARDMIS